MGDSSTKKVITNLTNRTNIKLPHGWKNILHKTTTLAARLGMTTHESPLRHKIRKLISRLGADHSITVEDWLVALANHRGLRAVFSENEVIDLSLLPSKDCFTDEELVVALCQLQCLDRPQILRLAAQCISRGDINEERLLRLTQMERIGPILKEIANQALHVDPGHVTWNHLANMLDKERVMRDPIIHWSRLAEPLFAPRSTKNIGWKLVR